MTGTGRVIATPPRKHDCAPGWTTKTGSDGKPYGIPPASWDYPKGTVWACPCGKTWVCRGAIAPNSPGFTWWRRERWWSRRHRADLHGISSCDTQKLDPGLS